MNSLDRKKVSTYVVDKQIGTAPLSNINIALMINRVTLKIKDRKTPSITILKRWYMTYLKNGCTQIGIRNRGVRCNH
ncbi:hypothetical protein [Colwellia sp. MB3u-4]|uniref:hypothetical protein n=1 Tax=Colwellia sp. MB3u-4 TaxID=2759822 RepID=UPI0015F540EC|nr:hypothetical protein [Colwellia sp. MB3u-4]MBA6288574.1 hypothetical protein [Colwellia sp. MB3u-4]